jgi:hypothetical protein
MKELFRKLKTVFGAETGVAAADIAGKDPVILQPGAMVSALARPGKESVLPPAPRKREEIIRFIIHALRPYVNEKNTGIKGIRLFVFCQNTEEQNLLNIALHADRHNAFKNDVLSLKFSDNYLYPEPSWFFEFSVLREPLPDCQISEGSFGLDIIRDTPVNGSLALARVTVLSGQAEKEEYLLDPSIKLKYKIGRGHHQALPSGIMHNNDIVFLSREDACYRESTGAANLTVSRYHALIVFNPEQNKYYIAAGKGGTPDSGNKTKLFTENGKMTRLDIAGALHLLADGDQIELGGSARLLFQINFVR